jgi:hypothetical protein
MKPNKEKYIVLLFLLLCFTEQLWASRRRDPGYRDGELLIGTMAFKKIENSSGIFLIMIGENYRDSYGNKNRTKKIPATFYQPSIGGGGKQHYIEGIDNAGVDDSGYRFIVDSIILPNSIRWINNRAFAYMPDLKYINIPDSITRIGARAFYNTGISSVFIPRKLTDIGAEAFARTKVESFQVDSANPVYASENGVLYNKSKTILIAYPPARKTNLFRIPENVTHIAAEVFDRFMQDSLIIPDNVKRIESSDFRVLNLTNTIYDGITRINNDAFSGCTDLHSVIIPKGVTHIGTNAFSGCTNLTSIVIPESVTTIEQGAFKNSGLTSVVIPSSVKTIERESFDGCFNLRSICISSSFAFIEMYAFRYCPLDTIYVPDSYRPFDFYYSFDLMSTVWYESQKEGMVYLGKTLCRYKGEMLQKTEITIPDGTRSIASGAFGDCTGLVKITLPKSLEYIGTDVFSGCANLKSINIPQNVKTVYLKSFYDSGIKKINVYWKDPFSVEIIPYIIDTEGIGAIPYIKCKLVVPRGTKKKYKQSGLCQGFKIVERKWGK